VPAIAQALKDWEGAPLAKLWASRWTICLLIGASFYFGHQWLETRGFNANWPDAIRCDVQLPDQATAKSPLIFYFNGMRLARRGLGDVAGYSLAGSYNKDGKYSPHEFWFRNDGTRKMVTPEELNKSDSLDATEKFYVDWFLTDNDCSGHEMADLLRQGRGYLFARPM
jgi:hypothetical protein